MNKVLLIGRLVRDPETQQTNSGIKYSRFTIAVNRPFGENQTDFIPAVAWRSQAEFLEKYIKKGSLVSLEGRFTSSTYQNQENQNVTRYEVTVDRVESLETRSQSQQRESSTPLAASATQEMTFMEENSNNEDESQDVPWELEI